MTPPKIPIKGYYESNYYLDLYRKNLEQQIYNNWYPNKNLSRDIIVTFRVHKDGRISNLQLLQSSGDKEIDNQALNTVINVTPFDPLPLAFTGSSIDIKFEFQENKYGNNKYNYQNSNNTNNLNSHNNNYQDNNRINIPHSNLLQCLMKNWHYKTEYGNYLNQNTSSTLYHFNRYPIKYWINTSNSTYKQNIYNAIEEYKKYFSMQEVKEKSQAEMFIYVLDLNNFLQACQISGLGTKAACTVQHYPHISNNNTYKASIYLYGEYCNNHFTSSTILHELGHAFGIMVHSEDQRDVMYPGGEYILNEDGSINNLYNNGFLTPRDLNSLFIIYNLPSKTK